MSGSTDTDKLALVSLQGNEMTLTSNELALSNNGVVANDFLPVLGVQENKGNFEQVSDDGHSRQRVQQQQQMVLRGRDTNDESVRVMEGMDQKTVLQENLEGKRTELTQEKTMKSKKTTSTSETQHEITERKKVTGIDMKDSTRAVEMETRKQDALTHKTEQALLVKSTAQVDKTAVKRDNQGYQQGLREQEELQLHAQLSLDGSRQQYLSGKLQNSQLLSRQTSEGINIQLNQTNTFFGIDQHGEPGAHTEHRSIEFTLWNYLRDPRPFVQQEDIKKSLKGFLDILYLQKKLPWGLGAKILYKFGLLFFFLVTFLYPTIIFIMEKEHASYNIVCGIFSFIGLGIEIYEITPDIYHYIKQFKERRRALNAGNSENRINVIAEETNATEEQTNATSTEEVNYIKKTMKMFKEFVIDSLGEILIYPSIICGLYGFVNERGWEFSNGFVIVDFVLLLYSVLMDAIYAKLYHIWILIRVVRASYQAYDQSESVNLNAWKALERLISPFTMIVPFAFTLVVTHWLVLILIGIRIYADNFHVKKDNSGIPEEEPKSGSYETTPFTRYMIFCGAYFPVASMLVYVILNKYWFLQIYWLIKNKGKFTYNSRNDAKILQKYHYIKHMPFGPKTMAFFRDPIAYFSVFFLIGPFIAFTFGATLTDYEGLSLHLPSKVTSAADRIGAGFIIFFIISNFQAVIIFCIFPFMVMLMAYLMLLFVRRGGRR